jgi:hypothetical protein
MANLRPPSRAKRGNSMKKTVTIFLGVMVAALMLTSFLSAVNSEIIIAKNTALVVTSQPVIASDTTFSALEPEKYDSMIKSFYLDEASEIDEGGDVATTAAPAHEDSAVKSADALSAAESDETIEAEALPEQDVPALLLAAVEDNNSGIETESPGITDNSTVFTVQAGSYTDRINAEEHYNSLIQNMNPTDLDNLRIEKVGKYYTIRLGKFEHYVTAMKFLNSMNSRLSSAIVLKAYIKNERIVELHNNAMLAGK